MLFAACGREGTGDENIQTIADASPTPKASAAAKKSAKPEATATAAPEATAAAAATDRARQHERRPPSKHAPEGQRQPAEGRHLHLQLRRKGDRPLQPGRAAARSSRAKPRTTSPTAGDDYTHEATNSEAGRTVHDALALHLERPEVPLVQDRVTGRRLQLHLRPTARHHEVPDQARDVPDAAVQGQRQRVRRQDRHHGRQEGDR